MSWLRFLHGQTSQAPYNPMYEYPLHQYHCSTSISPPPCPIPLRSRAPNQPHRPPLYHPQNPPPIQPRPNTTPNPNLNTNPMRDFPEKKPVQFTPIPMSYTNLLPYLLDNQMVVVSPGKIYQPLSPWWYNANVTCAYHGGVPGHSIEQCVAFKHKA